MDPIDLDLNLLDFQSSSTTIFGIVPKPSPDAVIVIGTITARLSLARLRF